MLSGSLCTLFGWIEEYHPRFVVSEHKNKKHSPVLLFKPTTMLVGMPLSNPTGVRVIIYE